MTVTTGNGAEALECLSRGTLELIYFAMRMAAGELLCQEESKPVGGRTSKGMLKQRLC